MPKLTALLVVLTTACFAQQDLKPTVIPPHPDAAALGRYGDFEMNHYTGTPSIVIPLYEIVENDISLPLSLSYDASGIKVAQTATWVGLGWVLNAGGVITRYSRGVTDGTAGTNYASVSQNKILDAVGWNSGGIIQGTGLADAKAIINGTLDADPDLYFFNFAGRSGKFIETSDGIYTLDRAELKIAFLGTGINGGWTITDENGFLYRFNDVEETIPNNYKGIHDFRSSWYLSSIKSPNGSEINFIYKPGGKEKSPVQSSYSYDVQYNMSGFPSSINNNRTSIAYTYSKKRQILDKITFSTGEVRFISTEGRLDGAASDSNNPVLSSGYKLNSIQIVSYNGNPVRYFSFEHGYFHNNSAGFTNYRLKLDNIAESLDGEDGTIKKHTFEYYSPAALPSSESKNMDHWGYYKSTAAPLLPTYNLLERKLDVTERDASGTAQTAGTLKKINYPTGGSTEFIFEPHDYSRVGNNLVNEDIIVKVTRGAGAQRPGNPVGYSEQFVINSNTTSAKINASFTYSALPNSSQLKFEIVTGDFDTGPLDQVDPDTLTHEDLISEVVVDSWWANSSSATENVTLPEGIYFLKATADANTTSVGGTISIYQKTGVQKTKYAGGLRIQKLISYDPVTQKNIIKKFEYRDENDTLRSSGVLVTPVKYELARKSVQAESAGMISGLPAYHVNMPSGCTGEITNWLEIRSSNVYPLGETSGSHVGYKRVIIKSEDDASASLGKVVETYTASDQFIDEPKAFPSVTGNNWDHLRGKLLTRAVYDDNDQILSKTAQAYDFHAYKSYWGLAIHDAYSHTGSATVLHSCAFSYSLYQNNIGKAILKRSVETSYAHSAAGTQSITKKISYYADKKAVTPANRSHTFTTSTVEWITPTDSITTSIRYAIDESGTVMDDMFTKHIIAPQTYLEKVSSVTQGPIYKRSNQYQLFDSKPLLSSIEEAPTGGSLSESIRFNSYDAAGRVRQLTGKDGVSEVYVWNEKNKVAARILNSMVNDVFVNDFENSTGNSTDPNTGYKSSSVGFTKTLTSLSNGTYKLQYWKKLGSAWELQTSTVNVSTGSYNISISGQVDDLRFYPANARVVTYIYNDAGLVTSIIDENNFKKLFSYDGLGRLLTVKDANGNIVTKYEYKFRAF
jgi:YD repeat-containing protein